MSSIQILNELQINNKITRMAYQLWERHSDEESLTIIGIEDGGAIVAHNICQMLKKISPLKISFHRVKLDKKNIEQADFVLPSELKDKAVVLIDDVANSGKTMMYAMVPIIQAHPRKVTTAVLVERNHKNFPIKPDITGHTVLTTLQDNIMVTFENKKLTGVHLC